jgi:glycosyltransferase involved in cell wall biosynthesis
MNRFCIITPTIGRASLRRCFESLNSQMYRNFTHVVVGDGPQAPWVRDACANVGAHYLETSAKEPRGSFGAAPRNFALDRLPPCEYVLFCDDDNVLLEPSLYRYNEEIVAANPPLLYQEIIFTSKYTTDYVVFPRSHDRLVVEREWDLLNGLFRRDVIGAVRFQPSYRGDYQFTKEVWERSKAPWVWSKTIGGVHHLSWDTYDG